MAPRSKLETGSVPTGPSPLAAVDPQAARWWPGLLLAAVTVLVFGPMLGYPFINFDDPVYVSANPHVQQGLSPEGAHWAFTSMAANFYHPLTWLSYMLDSSLYGVTPAGYRLTNLILHLASMLLCYRALIRATGDRLAAAVAAALFALHPLHVESVVWIAERKDALSTFFWMLTLDVYLGYAAAHNAAGRLLFALEDFTAAERRFSQAMDLAPGTAAAINNLATLRLGQGRSGEALVLFRQAVERDPHDPEIRKNTGLALLRRGRLGAATEALCRATRLAPADAAIRRLLDDARRFQGHFRAAAADLRRHLPEDADVAPAPSARRRLPAGLARLERLWARYTRALAKQPGFVADELDRANLPAVHAVAGKARALLAATGPGPRPPTAGGP